MLGSHLIADGSGSRSDKHDGGLSQHFLSRHAVSATTPATYRTFKKTPKFFRPGFNHPCIRWVSHGCISEIKSSQGVLKCVSSSLTSSLETVN